MRWLQLLAAVNAAPAVAEDKSLSFEPPFQQNDWVLTGAARALDDAVELVHAPGQSGAVWFTSAVPFAAWTLEAVLKPVSEFQNPAGTAGYTLWFTNEPQAKPADAALATHGGPDKWDGLAVMIDSLLDNGSGSVRGHLNDGSTSFSKLNNIGTESLSLCRIDFRQSATPVSVRIGYSEAGFVVSVNHQKCFMSTDIELFAGYFGVSANSDSTNDILGIERLAIKPGMISELYDLLPHHDNELVRGGEISSDNDAVSSSANDIVNERRSSTSADEGITKVQLVDLMQPSLDRIELMDVRMKQIQSALDQLTDTVSLSLRDSKGKPAKGGNDPKAPAAVPDLAGLHTDIVGVRNLITEWRKTTPAAPSASSSPSLLSIVCVLVPVQLGVVVVYHGWLRRREQRGKLL